MKKIMLFATVVAMSLAVAMPVNAQEISNEKQEGIDIPCLMESFDKEDLVAAWGFGKSSNNQQAYLLANLDAITSLANRFHLEKNDVERYANMYCRQVARNGSGEYIVYVSITIRKTDLFKLLKNNQ